MDDAGGDIVNTASVVSDEVPTPVTDTVTTPVVPSAPALTLVKSAPVNADEDGSGAVSVRQMSRSQTRLSRQVQMFVQRLRLAERVS